MPQSSADSEDESAPSEGCGVLALFLRSSDRICKTSTKSWSVNWRARFFSLDLRRCAFFKSFATRCFSIFACCCSCCKTGSKEAYCNTCGCGSCYYSSKRNKI